MPHDCLLLSPFPMDGQLAFAFEVHLTLFLIWTRLRQGLPTLFFFYLFVCLKQRLQRQSGLPVLQCYDRFRHINRANMTIVAVYVGACKPVRNGIILHVCAYSCHLTRLVSESEFCQTICLSSCRIADSIQRM